MPMRIVSLTAQSYIPVSRSQVGSISLTLSTGEPLQRRNLLRSADGQGRVFNPNPVVALKDFRLMDQGDSADAIPEEAYTDVILPELKGSGFLDGPYVSTRLTENRAHEPTLEFNYLRDDSRFEEVMVYYHIDAVGRYLKGLGFNFVDDWQIPANVHFGMTRAGFYDDSDGSINFGDAGVDVAEDAEVIIHANMATRSLIDRSLALTGAKVGLYTKGLVIFSQPVFSVL